MCAFLTVFMVELDHNMNFSLVIDAGLEGLKFSLCKILLNRCFFSSTNINLNLAHGEYGGKF